MVLQVKNSFQKKSLDSILEIDRRGGFDRRTHLGQPFLSTVRSTRDKTTADKVSQI
jgi:hypothetical protein